MEAIQVSIDGWAGNRNVVYTHHGTLASFKMEGNSNTCYNMNEPWGHQAKWNKADTKGQMPHDSTYMNVE